MWHITNLTPYTLRLRQNGHHFADGTFKYIFFNENVIISAKISLKFVPKGPINNIPALVQIIAWRRPGDKPLSEAMMVSLLTHICVTRPQWVAPGHLNQCDKSPSGHLRTNLREISTKIQWLSFNKIHLKFHAQKCCSGRIVIYAHPFTCWWELNEILDK